MGQLFLEHTTLSAGYFLEPNRAAAVIPPLAEEAFGDRPVRGIRKVDIDRNVPGGVDPISGPAIAGLFYTTKPDSWLPDLEEPLDWIIAQKTPESDLIIVEWHTTQKLGATTNICGPGTCARLTYDTQGNFEAQHITGEPIEEIEPRMACTALGRALGNLARGGLGYDVSPYMIDINDLARQVVEAGHQLTIPGAEEVSRALRLPYTPR